MEVKIKEAPIFFIVGFSIGVVCLLVSVVEYLRMLKNDWLNEAVPMIVIFGFVVLYFGEQLRKARVRDSSERKE